MNGGLESSVYFGTVLSLLAFAFGRMLQRRFRCVLLNPLLVAAAVTIAVLNACDISYDVYMSGAAVIQGLLTPATICLAVPLYEKFDVLKRHAREILLGILAGVLTSALCIWGMSVLFRLSREMFVTLLPKSVTTAIAMGISDVHGGNVTLTVTSVIFTGIFGNMIAGAVCRLFRISDSVAKGVGIGTAAHAIGTVKAMEMGRTEGAVSSLSLVISGLLTVIAAGFAAKMM